MSRMLRSHRASWVLLGLVALVPVFTGQSGCPMFPSVAGPDTGQQPAGPDTGKPTPDTPTGNGTPSVSFTSPAPGANYAAGDAIRIAFNANDPENDFSFDLFYDNDGVLNGNEVRIENRSQTGSSAVQTLWDTSDLPSGVYYIGAFVIDSAGNTDSAYVGPLLLAAQPTILVTAPAGNLTINVGDAVSIQFAGGDPGGDATIDVFYDTDNVFANGVTYISQGLSKTTTSAIWSTTGVATGAYYVGASIGRGSAGRIARYAPGAVTITTGGTPTNGNVSDLDIKVTQPPAGVTKVDVGAQVTIEFRGTDPKGEATINLFYVKAADVAGTLPVFTGTETLINATPLPSTQTSYGWTIPSEMETSVTYFIGASIGRSATSRKAAWAPGKVFVRVSGTDDGGTGGGGGGGGGTDPNPYVAVRSVNEIGVGGLRGIVFQGVNFNDFAGTSLTPIADIDGDTYGDFAIVAQFGKPGWDSWGNDGASVGEAYVIFGGFELTAFEGQKVSLNSTGVTSGSSQKGLPGLVLSGLVTAGSGSADRDGISGVFAIPDQDSDTRPELVFTFRSVDSYYAVRSNDIFQPLLYIEHPILLRPSQFLRGGLIVVSSQNSLFQSRTATDSLGGRQIMLSAVGQRFQDTNITPMGDPVNRWGCDPIPDMPAPENCNDPGTSTCTSPNAFGKDTKATGCAESGVAPAVGFESSLVDERAFRIWANGKHYSWSPGTLTWSSHGRDVPCRCPYEPQMALLGPSDIAFAPGSPDFFGAASNEAYDPFTGMFMGLYMNSGFVTSSSSEPYGMRIIGQWDGETFGGSLSFVDDVMIVGAPGGDEAYAIKMRNEDPTRVSRQYGVGYVDREPGPRPYMYVVGTGGSRSGPSVLSRIYASPKTDLIYNTSGRGYEGIGRHVQGTVDFDGDRLGDMIIGAPSAFNAAQGYDDSGAVYLIYRRPGSSDGSYDLRSLELPPSWPQRLRGVFIRGYPGDHFGDVVGTGANNDGRSFTGQDKGDLINLNADLYPDVVMGNYYHKKPGDTGANRGQVVILFGNPTLQSPGDGFRIEDVDHPDPADPLHSPDLLNGDGAGGPYGAIIDGEAEGDLAGYNVAYGGDFDGDGSKDLLISAPNAAGGAGKVYVIFGPTWDPGKNAWVNRINPGDKLSLGEVGKSIRGLVFVGKFPGDHLGGGEVAAADFGGLGTTGIRARNVSWAGDVNKDGRDDILIGAPMAPVGLAMHAGEVYLILGYRP